MLTALSQIVFEVGDLLLEWKAEGYLEGVWEGPNQIKAKADLMAHTALVERLMILAPGIPIISEEDANSFVQNRPESYWLIDPIDGTASFIQGYAGYVTQVALVINNYPCFAAIYAPELKLLYVGERHRGAFLNGKYLSVRQGPANRIIDNYAEPRGLVLDAYNTLNLSQYIECGSIGLKICKVADGTADLLLKNVSLHDWDLAAPQLILEEIGGVITDCMGAAISYSGNYVQHGIIVANNKESHLRLLDWYAHYSGG